jgi:hypothetical protein
MGEGLLLFSGLCSGVASGQAKIYSRTESPVTLTGWQFLLGGLFMCLCALVMGARLAAVSLAGAGVLLYLGFLSAVAYTLWSVLIKHNEVSGVVIYGFMTPMFGVLLSISIAVVWEFFEYGSDVFLQSDMQADTVIHAIYTKINRTDGIADVYENITETLVNQESLGINGYLDIGLIDTMHDMIIETVGAVAFLLYVLVDRNRHPMISDLPKDNHKGKRMEP